MSLTAYTILRQAEDGDYQLLNSVAARSAEAAVRQKLEQTKEGGTYVAIPERHWKPQAWKIETETRAVPEPSA